MAIGMPTISTITSWNFFKRLLLLSLTAKENSMVRTRSIDGTIESKCRFKTALETAIGQAKISAATAQKFLQTVTTSSCFDPKHNKIDIDCQFLVWMRRLEKKAIDDI